MLSDYKPADFRTISLVYTILIMSVSLAPLPPEGVGPAVPNLDKLVHTGLYFGFAIFLWKGFSDKRFLLAAFLYGVLIEFIQPTFGRSFELLDMAADGFGILLFYWFVARNYIQKRKNN